MKLHTKFDQFLSIKLKILFYFILLKYCNQKREVGYTDLPLGSEAKMKQIPPLEKMTKAPIQNKPKRKQENYQHRQRRFEKKLTLIQHNKLND